jgi:hypothetical protein
MEKFDNRIPVRFGLISFTVVLVIGLLMYVFYQALFTHFFIFIIVGLISLGINLFLGIWSGITYRSEHGGLISFGHAFLAVYIVFIFFSVGNIASIELTNKVIDRDYAAKASKLMIDKMSEKFDSMNMTDEQIKEATKNIGPEKFDPPFAELMKTFAGWLGFTGVVALLIALFIKRGSSDLINISAQ